MSAPTTMRRSVRDVEGERPDLTCDEWRVLHGIAGGLTNPQMATRSGMSLRTVGDRLESLYRKLDAVDRPNAVRRAFDLGLLVPGRVPS